jgi:hypothetical protein
MKLEKAAEGLRCEVKMEALVTYDIAGLPAQDLQLVAVQAARSGDPLTALNLIKELAVRCARDPAALMHVCTALNVHNNFCTLYSLLHCCVDYVDLFALFAEAQHAYGTRVYTNVTCNGVKHCVCVVTLYRVCVFSVRDGVAAVVCQFVTRDVNTAIDVRGGSVLCMPLADAAQILSYIAALHALPSPTANETAHLVLPAFQLQPSRRPTTVARNRADALDELYKVPLPPSPHTFNP